MKLSEIISAWENGETIQYQDSNSKLWRDVTSYDAWCEWQIKYHHLPFISDTEYRIKPRTLSINGVEFPEPLRKVPPIDTRVFVVSPLGEVVNTYCWGMMNMDKWLTNGFIHLSKEAATQHLNAILSVTRKDKGE